MTQGLYPPDGQTLRAALPQRSMSTLAQKYRALFSIDPGPASSVVRNLHPDRSKSTRLAQIGEIFVAGFNCALIEDDVDVVRRTTELIDLDLRGFSVEGAAMGAAVADALMLGGGRLNAWMALHKADYTYLVHVGAGWALARVPWRRRAILRASDQVHSWLIFDGLGFHDAYFTPARITRGWRRLTRGYAARAYDQGVGRGLWFAAAGDLDRAILAIASFQGGRQPDLWSGLGLALAYAGGASSQELSSALAAAGKFRAHLAQGAAFAAEAHARAGHTPIHTQDAVVVLCGCDAVAAVELVRRVRGQLPDGDLTDGTPRYELWRSHVQRELLRS